MTGWTSHPVIYEVNTWVWLSELRRAAGAELTLGQVPAAAWDEIALPGVDAVWLMGVWERSDVGRAIAMDDPNLQSSFQAVLPDLRPDDVVGSPYCVRRYVVDARLGGPAGLAVARAELARRGVRLLLDYVPNHVGPDHPWVTERPEVFLHGTADDLRRAPQEFVQADGQILARGRDPYFAPWPDVVQLDAFSAVMRAATVETLTDIGGQCDGVRCDMAMLLLNDVFKQTWPQLAGDAPAEDFWPSVLAKVRAQHPDMLFVAEAYWDLEWTLQQQGFDHCYDKRLYDKLVEADAPAVAGHLTADLGYQRGLVRFLENHDEPRAATTLQPTARERACAVVIATLPGATLWHEGQFEGRRVRLPVFLDRRPDEPVDDSLRGFHRELLAAVGAAALRDGQWHQLENRGWPDNPTHRNLLSWDWQDGDVRHVVVVNLSGSDAQARVVLTWPDLPGRTWALVPLLGGDTLVRDGDELAGDGLFVALPAWGWHLFAVQEAATRS